MDGFDVLEIPNESAGGRLLSLGGVGEKDTWDEGFKLPDCVGTRNARRREPDDDFVQVGKLLGRDKELKAADALEPDRGGRHARRWKQRGEFVELAKRIGENQQRRGEEGDDRVVEYGASNTRESVVHGHSNLSTLTWRRVSKCSSREAMAGLDRWMRGASGAQELHQVHGVDKCGADSHGEDQPRGKRCDMPEALTVTKVMPK